MRSFGTFRFNRENLSGCLTRTIKCRQLNDIVGQNIIIFGRRFNYSDVREE